MKSTEENNQVENGGVQQSTTIPEFTNSDAENLYNSCVDVQKNVYRVKEDKETPALSLHMDIELSKLIGKLRRWTEPLRDARENTAQKLGLISQGGNSYAAQSKFPQDEREQHVMDFAKEIGELSNQKFEHDKELFKMLPLKLFTESKLKDQGVQFGKCTSRQYFFDYCLVQEKNED